MEFDVVHEERTAQTVHHANHSKSPFSRTNTEQTKGNRKGRESKQDRRENGIDANQRFGQSSQKADPFQ